MKPTVAVCLLITDFNVLVLKLPDSNDTVAQV